MSVFPCLSVLLTLSPPPPPRLFFTPDVTKLNAAISANSDLEGKSLDEIMKTATGGVFNNAAQVCF